MRKRPVLTTLAALIVGIVAASSLTACGGNAASSEPDKPFVIALGNDPVSLSPGGRGAGNDMWNLTRQMYDSLVYTNPETGEIEPWLAESWSVSDDATAYTFHLRDDVTFSDGTPLNAEVLKANFDDIKEAGPAANAVAEMGNYAGTDVVDEYTAVVRFHNPQVGFLPFVSGVTMGLVSAETLKIPFEQRSTGEGVYGSGAWVLEEHKTDSHVLMRRREDYNWAPEHLKRAEVPEHRAQKLMFAVVPEAGNRVGGIVSGEFNAASVVPHDEVVIEEEGNYLVSRTNPGIAYGVYPNSYSEFLQDPAVRLAVAHTVDRPQILEGALSPRFNAATGPLSATTPSYVNVTDSLPSHDPEKAKQLLDDAGWVPGPDGIREKDGKRLVLRIAYPPIFPPTRAVVTLLQQQLAEVGIGAELTSGGRPSSLPSFLRTALTSRS
ncbi:ABC transporter substrate-binding protein [Corynebacterium timonense]|uniref:ABC transporter substrate-binding protein n=1 Tax=Corynebacterium timonense TaxID=441500 RepID=UPI0009F1E255|nr:ABC transporter substrate-binding protein [Corynebacterium timonense]